MIPYKNLSGKSGVSEYKIGDSYVIVKFIKPGKAGATTYKYTYASAERDNIEHMKNLAQEGVGLNAFINKEVKCKYESKS